MREPALWRLSGRLMLGEDERDEKTSPITRFLCIYVETIWDGSQITGR